MTRRYFLSWAFYLPPRAPREEVDYAGTEGLPAYCVARYEGGRMLRFERVLVVRRAMRTVRLSSPSMPGAWRYYRPRGQEIDCADELAVDYAATEGLDRYGAARVADDGARADLYAVAREAQFVDEYVWRADGALDAATVTRSSGRVEVYRFEPDGTARVI